VAKSLGEIREAEAILKKKSSEKNFAFDDSSGITTIIWLSFKVKVD